jgi:hypothetical protein
MHAGFEPAPNADALAAVWPASATKVAGIKALEVGNTRARESGFEPERASVPPSRFRVAASTRRRSRSSSSRVTLRSFPSVVTEPPPPGSGTGVNGGRPLCQPCAVDVLALASDTTNQLIAAGAALAGAVIGGVITLIGIVLQNRHARGGRQAEAATARRERAAAILGRVRTFLTDATPERIGINVNAERTPQEIDELSARLSVLRDELSMFATADEDDRVTARTAELEVALFNTLHWVRCHASDLLRHRDSLESLRTAQHWHVTATALVRIVLDLVRGRDVAELEAQLNRLEERLPASTAS